MAGGGSRGASLCRGRVRFAGEGGVRVSTHKHGLSAWPVRTGRVMFPGLTSVRPPRPRCPPRGRVYSVSENADRWRSAVQCRGAVYDLRRGLGIRQQTLGLGAATSALTGASVRGSLAPIAEPVLLPSATRPSSTPPHSPLSSRTGSPSAAIFSGCLQTHRK